MKDAHNNVPMNMIGPVQTSREILEDGDDPIFPVVLITHKALWYTTALLRDHIIHLMSGRLIQSVYDRTFGSSVRRPPLCLEVYEHHNVIICRLF